MRQKEKQRAAFEGFTLEEMRVSCSTCMGKEGEIMKQKEKQSEK